MKGKQKQSTEYRIPGTIKVESALKSDVHNNRTREKELIKWTKSFIDRYRSALEELAKK